MQSMVEPHEAPGTASGDGCLGETGYRHPTSAAQRITGPPQAAGTGSLFLENMENRPDLFGVPSSIGPCAQFNIVELGGWRTFAG